MFYTIAHLFLILILVTCVYIFVRFFLYRTAFVFVLKRWIYWIEDLVYAQQFYKVPELDENHQENQFYVKVSTYLNSLASIEDSDFTNLVAGKGPKDIVLSLDNNQTVHDVFLGARVSWKKDVTGRKNFVLRIKKKDKRRILRPYFQHIHAVSSEVEQRCGRETKLYMNEKSDGNGRWKSIPFRHPATFDTVIMDEDVKIKVKSDLESFMKSEKYYRRLGRAWRRSFLLYGPSGTGKSSFVAAMASYLNYDVYNLDFFLVSRDTDIRILLSQVKRRSLIVIEDLDQVFDHDQASRTRKIPSMLRFMDDLFCVGDEKVMVFTMNRKDLVDPVLLRPGRIDVHLYFPRCNFVNFKSMANGYLGITDHKLYVDIEEVFRGGAKMSMAEIGEIMISNKGSPSRALRKVIASARVSGYGDVLEEERPSESIYGGKLFPVKELKKLYGLLRTRSCREMGRVDHE